MYNPSVLIVSKRRELAFRYKKILKLLSAETILVDNTENAVNQIKNNEFEFIIISDTIQDDIIEFIKKIRILTYNFRPTIIAVSKSADIRDKLEILNAGADDFLSETMHNKEFQARINAHIRRHIESLTNPLTGFLNERLTRKTLKQILKKQKQAACLLLAIDGINVYREVYGEIAAEHVLKTIGAIILSALEKEDTIGHYSSSEFLIFTNSYKAEKLAAFLTFVFEGIIKKFYSEYDFTNNFVMLSNGAKEEKKVSLMKLLIGVTEYKKGRFTNDLEIIQTLFNLIKSLKHSEKSTYMVDRPKLYGEVDETKKNKILIMEKDEALGLLIETSCIINGYSAKLCASYGGFEDTLAEYSPDLIVIDYGSNEDKEGLYALDSAKKRYLAQNQKMPVVIFSTNILDKKSILAHGADFYLPKPYDIQTLIGTINDFLSH